jgi:hypothetical protein
MGKLWQFLLVLLVNILWKKDKALGSEKVKYWEVKAKDRLRFGNRNEICSSSRQTPFSLAAASS